MRKGKLAAAAVFAASRLPTPLVVFVNLPLFSSVFDDDSSFPGV